MTEKVREQKCRRLAKEKGLRLEKSKAKKYHPKGTYRLSDDYSGDPRYINPLGNGFGLSLDEVESILWETRND